MAIPGQYQIGGQSYDIDPNFTDLLYAPLGLSDLRQGFQFNQPQAPVNPVQPTAPQATTPNEGYINDGSGGDNESRARGIDPNSGLPMADQKNFTYPEWWGTDQFNPYLTKDSLTQYGGLIKGFMSNPIMTTINAMRLDPMKDKTLQDNISSYLGQIGANVSVEDIIAAYYDNINANWNSKVNAEDTIRGLVIGANPEYAPYFDNAVTNQHMRPDEFAGWFDTVNQYNAANPASQLGMGMYYDPVASGVLSKTENYDPNFSAPWNYAKTYGFWQDQGMTDHDRETIDRLSASYDRRAEFNQNRVSIAKEVDPALADRLDNGMRVGGYQGGGNNGGMGDYGGYGGDGNYSGYSDETRDGTGGGWSDGGNSQGDGSSSGGSSNSSGQGDSDGDSSNNGNGRHD